MFLNRLHKTAHRSSLVIATVVALPVLSLYAQESTTVDSARIEMAAERLPLSNKQEDWNVLFSAVHDTTSKSLFKRTLQKMEPFPRERIVSALKDDQLAVRLGALEILEEFAGTDYGFNPWLDPVDEAANSEAFAEWQKWAGEEGELSTTNHEMSEEDYRLYIREILSQDRNRSERAIRMLEPQGVSAIAALQKFLLSDPNLPEGGLARLKMAQYRLALKTAGNLSAASVAADLTFGNRDQQLAALGSLRRGGLAAIPIIRDYLDATDPLVRETAVDAIFEVGGRRVLDLLNERLIEEKDPNVILAAVRHLGDIKTEKSTSLLVHFTKQPHEDLVVASIEALNKGGSDDPFSSSSSRIGRRVPQAEELAKSWIDDSRWRVRTAAIQFIAARKLKQLGPEVIAALDDEDTYVRYSAVRAIGTLNLKDAFSKLEEMAESNPELLGHIAKLSASSGGGGLKSDFLARLPNRPPSEILMVIESLADTDPAHTRELFANLAMHADIDVACASLRALAEQHLKNASVRSLLLDIIDEGNESKIRAIVQSLDLPEEFERRDRRLSMLEAESLKLLIKSNEPTKLDALYDAFLMPNGKPPSAPDQKLSMPNTGTAAANEFVDGLIELMDETEDNEVQFHLAVALLSVGVAEAVPPLTKGLSQRPVNERRMVADALYSGKCKEAVPLLVELLNDPAKPVREEAASSAFNETTALLFIKAAIDTLEREDSLLKGRDIYGYSLNYCLRSGKSQSMLRGWARKVLEANGTNDELSVLAILMLRGGLASSDNELMGRLIAHRSQWVRRAAAEAAGHDKLAVFDSMLDQIRNDESSKVRGAIPMVFNQERGNRGLVYFAADATESYYEADYSYTGPSLDEDSEAILRDLATDDEDQEVRLESWFTLLSQRKSIDLSEFVKLASEVGDERLRYRIAYYLESNASALTPSLQPLLALADVDRISTNKRDQIFKKLGVDDDDAFLSFESLVDITDSSGPTEFIEVDPDTEQVERTKLTLVYFYKEGCDVCERVERYLEQMKTSFPLLEVQKISILSPDGTIFNQALASRMGVSSGKAPSLFAQGGAITEKDVDQGDIADLLGRTMALPQDEEWLTFTEEETVAAKEEVEQTFESLTLATVITSGLIDGINPCAFATIIFFLSYLQVARRTRREILMVGISFILAVFLSYFAFGLVLHKVIDAVSGLKWARMILDWAFGLMALVLAFLSFRDAAKVKAGKVSDMTLQLPGFIKNRIRGVIRTGAKSSRFVIAAFGVGVVISLLELSCTGQVYAPIIYKIQQGQLDAVAYLLIYNVAFILPLVVIFILAFMGMTSDSLVRFQERHTVLVKVALGIVFLLLAVLVLADPVTEWFSGTP